MLDLASIVGATGAEVVHLTPGGVIAKNDLSVSDLQAEMGGVQIDSRLVEDNDLFVALKGAHTDGHQFAEHAFTSGARAAIVSRGQFEEGALQTLLADSRPPNRGRQKLGPYVLVVNDSLTALQNIAQDLRSKSEAQVIGITGSVGKTTTKEIVASLLESEWPVLKSRENLNTEIGLPLTLMRLTERHRVVVLEMGMYAPGDIALLAKIASPKIGMVTNVGPTHLERMGSIENIARAKSELVQSLPPDGVAILNGDDAWTRAMARTSGVARTLLVGEASDCDYRATGIRTHGLDGVSFSLVAEGGTFEIRTRIPGTHTVTAFLMAVAAARQLDMPWERILEASEHVRLEGRQQIIARSNDVLIIDDSYNSAPVSLEAAFQLLAAAAGTKIAVLGDMLELGQLEEAAHREAGVRAAKVVDWLVVRGPRSRLTAESAKQSGLEPSRIVFATDNEHAVQSVLDIVATGHTGTEQVTAATESSRETPSASDPAPRWSVLVKGSRGMKLEDVVRGLQGGP